MPGLVPGIHVSRRRAVSGDKRAGRPTWMPGTSPLLSGLAFQRGFRAQERPSPPPGCHPGLDPGSREAGRGRCLWAWTPDQVRGDNGGKRTAGVGRPRSVSRSGRRAGNPPVPTPCTGSSASKPDSSGTSPGMTWWGRGRRAPRRPATPYPADARTLQIVMPGLVPGIHVLRHRGAGREGARRPTHVDARNKSGHDGGGQRGAGLTAVIRVIP